MSIEFEPSCIKGECESIAGQGEINQAFCKKVANILISAGGQGAIENSMCVWDAFRLVGESYKEDKKAAEVAKRIGLVEYYPGKANE